MFTSFTRGYNAPNKISRKTILLVENVEMQQKVQLHFWLHLS